MCTRGRSLGHAGVQSGPLPVVVQVALGADDKEGRLLPKALPHLQLHAGGARLPQLAGLAARAAASLTDKAALRHVQKLQERLANPNPRP